MKHRQPILRVAVPSPLRRCFDYLPPPKTDPAALVPGVRLRVPFGSRQAVGVLWELAAESDIDPRRIKPAAELLDAQPILPADLMRLLRWSAGYYHHACGEVVQAALPAALRRGAAAKVHGRQRWTLTEAGRAATPTQLPRAPKQAALLSLLQSHPDGLDEDALGALFERWRPAMQGLAQRHWVSARSLPCLTVPHGEPQPPPPLSTPQQQAVHQVVAGLDAFAPYVLDGVTGSGKTEVYLAVIAAALAAGRQALVLVPEISLTPQTVRRFQRRFDVPIALLHSGLNDQERLCAWLMAGNGAAPIVIGTRSAVYTPLRRLGAIIVDEEHDLSFKQQEGFRYNARDVAVMRAQQAGVPVVLGSATPSLESLHNLRQQRYACITLPERIGATPHPAIRLLDLRGQPTEHGLSRPLLQAVEHHLARGQQVLLFLNRRGYAPTLICHDCGWLAECSRCDARMTLHAGDQRLRCHHCGAERAVPTQCPGCASTKLRALGRGTEQVAEFLTSRFAAAGVVRIDRDSTRQKGRMQALLDEVRSGDKRLLIGTQMLAKGHHFPQVTLVGILDADQGLFGVDFRASERMAQLIVQVAGRAGRADRPGEVLIQTYHPDHPLLETLLRDGYGGFVDQALAERQAAQLPPYTSLALLRASATDRRSPLAFLEQACSVATAAAAHGVALLGPLPAPMERRAGRYRAQLLLQANQRSALHRFLATWLPAVEGIKSARRVRWSLDVDPMELV